MSMKQLSIYQTLKNKTWLDGLIVSLLICDNNYRVKLKRVPLNCGEVSCGKWNYLSKGSTSKLYSSTVLRYMYSPPHWLSLRQTLVNCENTTNIQHLPLSAWWKEEANKTTSSVFGVSRSFWSVCVAGRGSSVWTCSFTLPVVRGDYNCNAYCNCFDIFHTRFLWARRASFPPGGLLFGCQIPRGNTRKWSLGEKPRNLLASLPG